MNRGPVDRPGSAWLAAFVALCVGLGAQVLLESVMPADLANWSFSAANDGATVHAVTPDALWISGSIIRFLSFAIAGMVAVFLLGALTGRLLGALIVVTVLATFFEQFPSWSNWLPAVFWGLAAPIAVFIGAWFASARRGSSTPLADE